MEWGCTWGSCRLRGGIWIAKLVDGGKGAPTAFKSHGVRVEVTETEPWTSTVQTPRISQRKRVTDINLFEFCWLLTNITPQSDFRKPRQKYRNAPDDKYLTLTRSTLRSHQSHNYWSPTPRFYANQRPTTVFAPPPPPHQLTLSHSISSNPTPIPTHMDLGLPSELLPSALETKIL